MFPFRKRTDRPKPPPRPTWLKWLLLAFVGYIILMSNAPRDIKTRQVIDSAKEKIVATNPIDFAQYKSKIFPQDAAGLRVSEVAEGAGNPAVCGQHVKIAYESFLAQGNALPDKATKEKPLSFTIGDGHVMPVFDRGVIGMKAGGKRSVIAPPLMSYGLEQYHRDDVPKGAAVRFEMELLSVEPTLPDVAVMPYRIAEVAGGNGNMLVCGEAAALRLKIWDLSGKLLYSNEQDKDPLTITIGKSDVMLGLEQGVMGMQDGGVRLLIIPPAYQQTMSGEKAKTTFPLPKDQTVMVEVRSLVTGL